jgi:hypothetical protein
MAQQRKLKGNADLNKRVKRYQKVDWSTILNEKEKHVVPLNLNIDLRRLT